MTDLRNSGRCIAPALVARAVAAAPHAADLGKPFDVMVYLGAKHGLTRQHDGRRAYATIKRFFDEHLGR